MKRLVLASIAAPSLAACGQAAPISNDASEAAARVQNAAPELPAAETPDAPPAASEPTAIPAKFRGTWANTVNACADLGHHSRLVVSDRSLRYADFVLLGEDFTYPAADEFAVEGKVEGKSEGAAAHFSLNKHGDLLRDEAGGGTVRMRCG